LQRGRANGSSAKPRACARVRYGGVKRKPQLKRVFSRVNPRRSQFALANALLLHTLLPRLNWRPDDRRNLLDGRPRKRGYVAKHVKRHALQAGARQSVRNSLCLGLRRWAKSRLKKLLHAPASGLAGSNAFLRTKFAARKRADYFCALNNRRCDGAGA
jgi:hypothetical protein